MTPDRQFGLVSRALFVGAALLALAPAAIAQDKPQGDADLIKAIPEPRAEEPVGLEAKPETAAQPAGTPVATTPATAPANQAPAVSEDIKKLTGKKLIEAPLANLSGADAAIAEKLRELIALRGERFLSRKEERDAVEVFYRDRGFKPLWIENGAEAQRTAAAVAYIKGIDADGMEPADYPAPNFKLAEADKLAEQELIYTAEILEFIRHASTGRVHWSRVTKDAVYSHSGIDPLDMLNKLATGNAAEVLASAQPPHEQYRLLKAQLAELRGKTEAQPIRIPAGNALRFNAKAKKHQEDARVPLLRERLGLAAKDNKVYDEELAQAVAEFQKSRKRKADGVLTNEVVAALNPQISEKTTDIIIANMERWRWLRRDLGKHHVIVSIPGYYLRVFENQNELWETRIVVGLPNKATPILTQEMKFITVNPTWNVPPSIIANEYIPALRQDPEALTRIGLRVTTRPDGTIHVYQPPGDANALGRIRFNFPNKFLVYQHDTPTKHLFAHDERAYSHGCMRVQNPLKYAEVLLNIARPGEGWSEDKVKRLYGGAEQNLDFKVLIPVHIVYNTAEVEDGKLTVRKDIYKIDAATIRQLKATGNERKQLEVAIAHRNDSPNRQALTLDGYYPDRGPAFDFFGLFRTR